MPNLDTSLWRVAWDGDDVVGSVMTFIWPEENESLGLNRGWLEHISVRRPWRNQGVAKALIVDLLRTLRTWGSPRERSAWTRRIRPALCSSTSRSGSGGTGPGSASASRSRRGPETARYDRVPPGTDPGPSAPRVILLALRRYGILADNDSAYYITGAPHPGWDDDDLHDLHAIMGSMFEVVDTTAFGQRSVGPRFRGAYRK